MNRAPLLLFAVAILGGGLAFFATQTAPTVPGQGAPGENLEVQRPDVPTQGASPRAAAQSSSEDTLAAVSERRTDVQVGPGGRVRSWEIIPMNSVGQRIDEAKIVAEPGPELTGVAVQMNGEGRTRWSDLAAGSWTITVEVDGEPSWTQTRILRENKAERTVARIGESLHISGEVRDSYGAPLQRKPVFLLPKGVSHPKDDEIVRSGKPRERGEPSNGAIAATTAADGTFRAVLPKAGEYRVSVGPPGKPRWTEKGGTELTHGGNNHLVATVPAKAQLTLSFQGPEDQWPTQVSAYYYDDAVAARLDRERFEREVQNQPSSIKEAQRKAKLEAQKNGGKPEMDPATLKGGRGGTARTMREEHKEAMEKGFEGKDGAMDNGRQTSAPLFQPGWRNLRSESRDGAETVVFHDLPENVNLRFLFVRTSERITTETPIRMRTEQRALGKVTLPPPSTLPGLQMNNLATVQVGPAPKVEDEVTFPLGVEWSTTYR